MIDIPDFETFCADPQLLNEPISPAWITFFRSVEGLPLDDEGVELFCQCTGRSAYVPQVHVEATGIIGRRGEKTSTTLKYLIWKCLYAGWQTQLRRSFFRRLGRHTELLRVPLIAQDMRVARDIQRAAESLVLGSPVVSREVADILATEIV
jgi:hypothetical protein